MSVSTMAHTALGTAVAFEVAGKTSLRKIEQFTWAVPTLAVAACHGAALFLLPVALEAMQPGVACVIWSGISTVSADIVGATLFEQSLGLPAMLGIGTIIGIVMTRTFSATRRRQQ